MKKRIVIVVGTRPEAIKLAPLYLELKAYPQLDVVLVSTGQHREMLRHIFAFFEVQPNVDLDLMQPNQTLGQFTGLLFQKLDRVVAEIQPALVVVQGDTTSAMVGSMLGFYHKIPVAHVEAGLRTNDKYAPFPEEINRRVVSLVADFHFAPTPLSAANIKGKVEGDVFVVGNSVIDSLLTGLKKIRTLEKEYEDKFSSVLRPARKLILVTTHRRENFGEGLKNICSAILKLAEAHPDIHFIFPVHLNPNVRQTVHHLLGNNSSIRLIEPVDYDDMIFLMSKAWIILTDSGGLQEEAPTLNVPVLVLREVTERPEGIDAGCAMLVGTREEGIVNGVRSLLNDPGRYKSMQQASNPYGDGRTCERIGSVIGSSLGIASRTGIAIDPFSPVLTNFGFTFLVNRVFTRYMAVFSRPGSVFITLFIAAAQVAFGQGPVAGFTVPAAACLNERVKVVNGSSNATSFEWDFCLGDFQSPAVVTDAATIAGLSEGYGYKLVEDNGEWFGFAVSQGGSKVFRLEFGDSPLNAPLVSQLQTTGTGLDRIPDFPHEIELYKTSAGWYGFVTSNELDQLTRLKFGSSLANVPVATNMGVAGAGIFGVSDRVWDISIVKQGVDLILVMAERNSGSITRVNFRDSFENTINPGVPHVVSTGTITGGGNQARGIEVVRAPSGWVALLVSHFDSKIYQVNFGADLLGAHTVPASYTFGGVSLPNRISIANEGKNFYGVVSNDPTPGTNDPVKVIDFKDLDPAHPPVAVTHAGLPELVGIDAIRYQGQSIVQGVGLADNKLKQLRFELVCGASVNYSSEEDPVPVTYNSAGAKNIELRAFGGSESAYDEHAVTVSATAAPDIDMTFTGACATSPVAFTAENTSGNITSYAWTFGDTQGSSQQDPQHIYAAAGDYTAALLVTASNACTNSISYVVPVFNKPVANFSISPAGAICTNQLYSFDNTSTYDLASGIVWEWLVNDVSAGTLEDFSYTFTATQTQVVKLKVSIPGCETEKVQNFTTIQEGPVTNFTVTGKCEDVALSFMNTTTGTVSGYNWDFGNGIMSTATSPTQVFVEPGMYTVILSSSAVNGCNTNTTKTIEVFSSPKPNFSLDLPPFSCSGTPSQFHDLTPSPDDSNLQSWDWTFGDNSVGTGKNPAHTYSSAGLFAVKLTATSDKGCSAIFQKDVTIEQTPQLKFSNDPPCVNQATRFTDGTTGTAIKSWQWKINQTTYLVQNPVHVFLAPGTYTTDLSVTATNGCFSSLNKTLVVPSVPFLDFSISNACASQAAVLTDLTVSAGDPIVKHIWDFGAGVSATGTTATHVYGAAGVYPLKLSIENTSGCKYALTRNVTVYSLPEAGFTVSDESGPPPLSIKFTNTSKGASVYSWKFNDGKNSTTNEVSPVFTYPDLGEYLIDLTATNDKGCSHVFTKKINVIIPRTELELEEFTLVVDEVTGSLKSLLKVRNNSNYTVRGFNAILDLGSGILITEKVSISIEAGKSDSFVLANALTRQTDQVGFVCARLEITDDENNDNNRVCLAFGEEPILFTPYPNPSDGLVFIETIAAEAGDLQITIINSVGSKVFDKIVEAKKGLNIFVADLTNQSPGIYIAVVSSGSQSTTVRIALL